MMKLHASQQSKGKGSMSVRIIWNVIGCPSNHNVGSSIMAKFVVAGKADCPRFARAELLADKLSSSLPHFRVHKVIQSSSDWPSWLSDQCSSNSWTHSTSPLIWRELVDRGGKQLYLGGLEEFSEYAAHYYSIQPDTDMKLDAEIAQENQKTFDSDRLATTNAPRSNPLRVCITNAMSPVAYHLAQFIALGHVFGQQQKVAIQLYNSNRESELEGLKMELVDLASPLLIEVTVATSLQEAFNSVDTAFILDYPYEGSLVELSDALIKGYHEYAVTIDFCASKDVRVIVSGCYANLGAAIIAKYASSISSSKVIAAPSLVEQQAKSILANKLNVNAADISKVCVWGRTSGPEMVVDLDHTRVQHFNGAVVGPDPYSLPITRCVFEPDWVSSEFPTLLSSRHGALAGYHTHPTGSRVPLVEAVGLTRLLQVWEGCGYDWVSVGVVCGSGEAWYGMPEGIVCSLPARCEGTEWVMVQGISINDNLKENLMNQVSLLKSELDNALEKLKTD